MALSAFALFRATLLAGALFFPATAWADSASPWSTVKGAAVRLIAGNPGSGAALRAGLEFKLDQHWKTYWRYPGDSGVPPVFDWSKSDNLASIAIAWPAPQRFEDEGGTTIGYDRGIVLPLTVTAKDPKRPVSLELTLDYAVCEKICVPAKANVSLALRAGEAADPALDTAIAAAEATVPLPVQFGRGGPFAIRRVELDSAAKPQRLTIETASPQAADLFVEGPANWYLPLPQKASRPGVYTLALEGLPKGASLHGVPLRLTLSTGAGGIETVYTLP